MVRNNQAAGGRANRRLDHQKLNQGIVLGLTALFLSACAHPDNGLDKPDYKALLNNTPPATAMSPSGAAKEPPIPDLQPILAAPPPSVQQRLVTITVPDPNIPLRDVLIELARKVDVDADIDPNIQGGIIFYAKDKPFSQVMDRIAEMANLRYSFKNGVMRVEVDSMYHQIYNLSILNASRTATTDIGSSANLSSTISGGGGGGGNNSSTSEVKGQSVSDPWGELDANIKQILYNSTPRNQPVTSNVNPEAVATGGASVIPAGGGAATKFGAAGSSFQLGQAASGQLAPAGDNGTGATPIPSTPGTAGQTGGQAGAQAGTNPIQAAQQIANQTAAAGNAGNNAATPASGASTAAAPAAQSTTQAVYSINKQAGIVSVFGTSRQQKLVKDYLEKLVAKADAQVLIEAKVVEVVLNDQYNTGVDWAALRQNLRGTGFGIAGNNGTLSLPSYSGFVPGNIASYNATLGTQNNPFSGSGLTAGFTTAAGDLAAMINLLKVYGTTRTLSSPRITVMNNQTAVLKVAENDVFFRLQATVTSTPSTTGGAPSQTATYTSTLQTVPIGVVMSVQPAIDIDNDQVTLGLRPTVTALTGNSVSDPAVALQLASACSGASTGPCSANSISTAIASSNVPIIDVREMESVVTVPSGEVVVMGGMMQEVVSKQESGIPGAADTPVLGNLFKSNTDQTQLTELIIFLKATLVHGPDSVQWADKDLYQKYIHDPRPLGM